MSGMTESKTAYAANVDGANEGESAGSTAPILAYDNGKVNLHVTPRGGKVRTAVRVYRQTILDLHLDGYREGLPRWVSRADWYTDRLIYESGYCRLCGAKAVRARPFHERNGFAFVVVLECRQCGQAEEA